VKFVFVFFAKNIEFMCYYYLLVMNFSVYSLQAAVFADELKLTPSVIADYGFGTCETEDDLVNMFGVYADIIKSRECNVLDLHKACVANKLADFIDAEYKKSQVAPNVYCKWFNANRSKFSNLYG
jgi:hypothetical protein